MRTPSLTLPVTSRRQAQQLIAAVRTPSLTLRVTSLNRKVRRAPHRTHPGPKRREVSPRIADLAGGLQLGDAIPPPSRRADCRTPRRMSFKSTWTTSHILLWSSQAKDSSGWRTQYRQALLIVTQDKLPNRPGRSFEQEAYTRRPKSTQFQKRKSKIPNPNQTLKVRAIGLTLTRSPDSFVAAQPPAFCWALAQLSRSVTARLKIGWPGLESTLSAQK